MVEYLLAFAGLLIVVATLWCLVGAIHRSGVRAENLVASEYP